MATGTHLRLQPGRAGWSALRGAAPRGVVSERALLLVPGFGRPPGATLRLGFEPASRRDTALVVKIAGAQPVRLPATGLVRVEVPVAASSVPGLVVELVPEGGAVRMESVELLAPRAGLLAPLLCATFALATLGLAARAGAPAEPLAVLAAGLAALVAGFPFTAAMGTAALAAWGPAAAVAATASVWGLRRSGRAFVRDAGLVAAFLLGLGVRVLFLFSDGSWDTDYWKAWSRHTRQEGLTLAYGPERDLSFARALAQLRGTQPVWTAEWAGRRFTIDYPPLAALAWTSASVAADALWPALPAHERESAAARLPGLLGDVLALLVLPWAYRPRLRRGLALALLYWATPLSWMNSAVLGYFDGVLPPLLVVALRLATLGHGVAAGVVLGVAACAKPTAVLTVLPLALALGRAAGRGAVVRATLAAAAVGVLVWLPFALAGTLLTGLVHVARMFVQSNLSGGYPNGWWLLGHVLTAGGEGARGPVAFAPTSLFAPLPVGLLGALAFLALGVWAVRRQGPGFEQACETAGLLYLAYATLATGVHENHPHPAFLLLLAGGLATRRGRLLAAFCGAAYALNMVALSGLGRFHGERYLWLLPLVDAAAALRMSLGFDLTLALAAVHLAAFAAALRPGGRPGAPAGGALPGGTAPPAPRR